MKKNLYYLCIDNVDRPTYKDDEGQIWKDVFYGKDGTGNEALCATVNNDIYGEPDFSMDDEIEVTFIPNRIIFD